MGFTVAEELNIPKYGITASNCYVTIRAAYTHDKMSSAMVNMIPVTGPYVITSRWFVYASNNVNLAPLCDDMIVISCETVPANPIATIYAAVKEQHFAGKTITDDL